METSTMKRTGGTNIVAIEGDVTRQPVAAVVNSANETLQHNDGVATAVVRTGGRVIQEESDAWIREHGPVKPGSVAVTTGGMLQASHVIHAVGPNWDGDSGDPVLTAAVVATLDAAVAHQLLSVAFPMISAGHRGYPPQQTAKVMVAAVFDWLADHEDEIEEIRLVGFHRKQAELLAAELVTR